MKLTSIRTEILAASEKNLIEFIDCSITSLNNRSVIAVTSKIVAILERRTIKINESNDKDELVKAEADYYLPKIDKYNIRLTIKDNLLIPSAGIDESNAFGNFILWPKDPYKSARKIRGFLARKFGLCDIGVVITDSKTTPLRWGTTGVCIGYSGFEAVNNYIGKLDLFGRELKYTQANIADGIAAAAVLVMGEGAEQTPIVICEKMNNVKFKVGSPTLSERKHFNIELEEDLYYPILSKAKWEKKK